VLKGKAVKYEKKVISRDLPKCYAIGMFNDGSTNSILIGVEKKGPIVRFALDGSLIDTPVSGPGGVMTLVQVPGRTDQFLSTTEFYSPNCGGDHARISSYTKQPDGSWKCATLVNMPYVHRFGILKNTSGNLFLLACTIKSACEYKNDWRFPGKIFGGKLSHHLEEFTSKHSLPLKVLKEQQLKNHGFYTAPDRSYALIGTNEGCFKFEPPESDLDSWKIKKLFSEQVSDISVTDFDNDGQNEIISISPFHGNTLTIWHKDREGLFTKQWVDPQKREFLHAIWAGVLCGQPCAIVGHRKGDRDLIRVFFDDGDFHIEKIDHDRGPTNCWVFSGGNLDKIVAANRETDEVAFYTPYN
jgi:hypothetical protein